MGGYGGQRGGRGGAAGWEDREAARKCKRRGRVGEEGWKWGGSKTDRDSGPGSFIRESEPSPLTQAMDMLVIMRGVIRADGGILPCGSVKERAMSSLYSERFFY